ncbi:hypothetical protein [Paenibacillus thalictri]|uniref:Uncharacterized protein n=1 Tax=Paenibacillus thalictri TaxID=2527873 RepID=A0A4Q9DN97_9BACL|nr:hypothetical protein [Paenibacillus thalictri]TBL77375.1 hypothetical protein EYB31_18035 [Paenibacillus thalictri]
MNAAGYSQECVWPLWRGFADCMQLLQGVDARGDETFEKFARRLQLFTFEEIGKKAPEYAAIVESLHEERNRLTEHILNRSAAL